MAFRKTSVCDVFEDEPLTPEIQINDYRKKLIADPYFWVQGSPKSKRKSNTLVVKDNSKSQVHNGIYHFPIVIFPCYITDNTYILTHTGSLSEVFSIIRQNSTKMHRKTSCSTKGACI